MPDRTELHPGLTEEVGLFVFPLLAIAGYNALELFFWIFDFFRRYRGCYFWSVLVATLGILVFVLGSVLQVFDLAPPAVAHAILPLAIIAMATGSAMTLYARIHLITTGRTPQFVLAIIIVTTCVLHVPLAAIFYVGVSSKSITFHSFYEKFEIVVIMGSCVRELVILGVYIWAAVRNLKPVLVVKAREGRRVVRNLLAVNVIVVCFEVVLLVMTFSQRQLIKMGCGALMNSVKLKMEFAVLNKLVTLVQSSPGVNQISALRLSSEDRPFSLSDRDEPSDTSRSEGSTQNDSHRRYIARAVPSPTHALSYGRLFHDNPDRSYTEIISDRRRLQSPWRGRG
jgi:hypothetical protein